MTEEAIPLYELNPMEDLCVIFANSGIKGVQTFSKYGTAFVFSVQLNPKGAPKAKITAIDISGDMCFIATGHEDGSIALWSVTEAKWLKTISPYKGASEITDLEFGITAEVLFSGDSKGMIHCNIFKKRLGLYSTTQNYMFNVSGSVGDIRIADTDSAPNIGFISSENNFYVFNTDLAINDKPSMIMVSDPLPHTCHLDLITFNGVVYLVVGGGKKLSVYSWGPDLTSVEIYTLNFEGENIISTTFLDSSIAVVVTSKGTMSLVSIEGRIIGQGLYDGFMDLFAQQAHFFRDGDDIVIFSETAPARIVFTNWKRRLQKLVDQHNFEDAFRILQEIHIGVVCDLVGLSPNMATRRIEVRQLALQIIEQNLNEIIDEEDDKLIDHISSIIVIASKLNSLISTLPHIYDRLNSVNKTGVFFRGCFMNPTGELGLALTSEMLQKYFDSASESGTLNEAENVVCALHLDRSKAKEVLKLAHQMKMLRLEKKILVMFFKNYIAPCQLYSEAGKLSEYCEEIFFGGNSRHPVPEFAKRGVAVWLAVPTDGKHQRLRSLFESDWARGGAYMKAVLELCPITYSTGNQLTAERVVEAALFAIHDAPYSSAENILSAIMSHVTSDMKVTPVAMKNVLTWIVSSRDDPSTREYVFNRYLSEYPELVNQEQLGHICEMCGFISIAHTIFVPNKDYVHTVGTYVNNTMAKGAVFEFINQHIEDRAEIEAALRQHILPLLHTSAQKTAHIVAIDFPHLIPVFQKKLTGRALFRFMNALFEDATDRTVFENDFIMKLFEMFCTFRKRDATKFVKDIINDSSVAFDTQRALEIAKDKKVIGASIAIHRAMNNNKEAVDLIDDEIEHTFVRFIERGPEVNIESIDELPTLEVVEEPYEAVHAALDLLESLRGEPNILQMWIEVFKAFQFPLFHCRSRASAGVKKAVTLMFTEFIIASLTAMKPELVFTVLTVYFSAMDTEQYHSILSAVFAQLNYKKNTFEALVEMQIGDALNLNERAFTVRTSGFQSEAVPVCGICHEPLARSLDPFRIYPCGHCIHENSRCGCFDTCQVCSGAGAAETADEEESGEIKPMSARRVQQCMRRFEFAMKRNYGEADECDAPHAAFFAKLADDFVPEGTVDLLDPPVPMESFNIVLPL